MNFKEVVDKVRAMELEEKFPEYKAIVQGMNVVGLDQGDAINVLSNEDSEMFKDEQGLYKMTLEQAFELQKLIPHKKHFIICRGEPYYNYIKSKERK